MDDHQAIIVILVLVSAMLVMGFRFIQIRIDKMLSLLQEQKESESRLERDSVYYQNREIS